MKAMQVAIHSRMRLITGCPVRLERCAEVVQRDITRQLRPSANWPLFDGNRRVQRFVDALARAIRLTMS